MMKPHRRQFVIGTKPFLTYKNWCTHQIDSSIYLSYCPELRASFTQDADGECWGILGLAIETLEYKLAPPAEITRTPSNQVPEIYPSWAGRWVLVGQSQVHMDASGFLGCFYCMTSDNQMWVSSSPTLLASILSSERESSLSIDSRLLRYENGISWFTPPRSRFIDIKRLLPSQVLDLKDSSIRPRPLMPPIDLSLGFDKTLELVKRSLVTTVQRLSQEAKGSQLWLGLTAGFDSRTLLALAKYTDIDFLTFTRITQRSAADRLLPPKLARECGCKHVFMHNRKPKHNLERKQLIMEHNANHVSDGEAEPFITGVRDGMEGISFGGHGWEVARCYYFEEQQFPDSVENSQIGAEKIARLLGEPVNSTAVDGLHDWLKCVLKHPQEHLNWSSRFHIEQRLAGWMSAKEQLYDLTQLERFPILNAARNYSLLLGLEENQRISVLLQKELIRQLAPELLKYPFNPPDSYFGSLQVIATRFRDNPLSPYQKITEVGKKIIQHS